jgi:hypothetical protein
MVIGTALHDYVVCQFALRQQRICRDEFAFNVDGIEQLSDHADFVGLLLLITAFYGQSADFFWV